MVLTSPGPHVTGRSSPVMLSPFVALRVNSAKHLCPSSQPLRLAYHDNRGMLTGGQPGEAAEEALLHLSPDESRKITYVGITTPFQWRLDEHRHHLRAGFPSTDPMKRFVSCEETSEGSAALAPENHSKGGVRTKQESPPSIYPTRFLYVLKSG
jgi:predicted GIY-YIG superfamily endonuclease